MAGQMKLRKHSRKIRELELDLRSKKEHKLLRKLKSWLRNQEN